MYNFAFEGGAVGLRNGTLIVDTKASVKFSHNSAGATGSGGAIWLYYGMLTVTVNASLNFNNDSWRCSHINKINFHIDSDHFHPCNNRAIWGGAMFFSLALMYINKSVKFVMNTARDYGGAIFIKDGIGPSIIVGNYSKLLLFNNTSFQGGALSAGPSMTLSLGYQSTIKFINNTASDVGGAVYSFQFSSPCTFNITDCSAKVCFRGNCTKWHWSPYVWSKCKVFFV